MKDPEADKNARISFFDEKATTWDEMVPEDIHYSRLLQGLDAFGVRPDEQIVDLGCGTGILTKALLTRLSSLGRVHSVDFSARMLARSQSKIPDRRVSWHLTDAAELPIPPGTVDRVICFSAWPHFRHDRSVARACYRVLKPGGSLHIWHGSSKEFVNEIHAEAGPAVAKDILAPAQDVANMLRDVGFQIETCVDASDTYLITAQKKGAGPNP